MVRLVASHPHSWEEAAAHGIAELAKTSPDLRVARVAELDTVVREGAVAAYRVRLEASYRIDRRRTTPDGPTTVRRYLLVANKTLGTDALRGVVQERISAGPAEFHVLVPESSPGWVSSGGLADPLTGFLSVDADAMQASREEARRDDEARLREEVARLRALGVEATGELGEMDPLEAVAAVLERASFDEIILATLPVAVSRWLRVDLARRLERRFGLPVTHVAAG